MKFYFDLNGNPLPRPFDRMSRTRSVEAPLDCGTPSALPKSKALPKSEALPNSPAELSNAPRRGRPLVSEKALTAAEKQRRYRERKKAP